MAPVSEETVINQKLKELSGLVEQREQIQARIIKTEAAIRAFIELLEDETDQKIYASKLAMASKPLGLTEVIKYEVCRAGRLTPAAVRDRLTESGFPLSGYSNPLAVIYTTLTRLIEQGMIKKLKSGEYEWIGEKKSRRNLSDYVMSPPPKLGDKD